MSHGQPGIDLDFERLTFSRLEAVVPVGLSAKRDNITFVLQSIERYDAGFVVHLDVELHIDMPTPETGYDPDKLPPEMRGTFILATATDDLGNTYEGNIRGGHGGGRSDGVMEIRHITVLTPALAQAAGLLTLTIFLVERMRYTENGQVDVKAVDSPIGPWQVTFPLRAGTVEGSAEHTRVIPIAEQLLLDSVGMSILSLELSPFGFRVIARLDWSGRTGPFPRTVWHATDDLGGVYRTANCAGAGGGAMPQDACDSHPRSWRMSCVFSRPVNPDASRLELRVEEVSFQTLIRDDDPGAQPRWEQSGLIGNMGTLTIDLT